MRHFLTAILIFACMLGASKAQNYPSGTHLFESNIGELLLNAGHVSHLNAHSFYVYTFLFKPAGADEWHQVPIMQDLNAPLVFILNRTATADFTTRDAKVHIDEQKIMLSVGQLQYEMTPYDDNATVQIQTYRLAHEDESGRWAFVKEYESSTEPGTTIDKALSTPPDNHRKEAR